MRDYQILHLAESDTFGYVSSETLAIVVDALLLALGNETGLCPERPLRVHDVSVQLIEGDLLPSQYKSRDLVEFAL